MADPSASSNPGILSSSKADRREDCEASVKGFSKALYKGFNNRAEAMSYVAGHTRMMKQAKDAQAASRVSRDIPVPMDMPSSSPISNGSTNGFRGNISHRGGGNAPPPRRASHGPME